MPRAKPSPDSLPPHDTEAEAGALACLLNDPGAYDLLDRLFVSDFYELKHQEIFRAMHALRAENKPITVVELYQFLKAKGRIDQAGGFDFLQTLPDQGLDCSAFQAYADTLSDLGYRRGLLGDIAHLSLLARDKAIDRSELHQQVQAISKDYADAKTAVTATPIGTLQMPPDNDPTELLKHRFLCQRAGLLISGPTGMGKSSFLMQAYALWANGLPFLGIVPVRKMRCLLIQAENDDGDLAAMRDGICTGLNFTQDQRQIFFENVLVHTSTGIVGKAFFTEVVHRLLDLYSPLDFTGIDPALSFIGGDVKEQKVVGEFLRTYLNPLLFAYQCASPLLHHTNKPPSGKEKPSWRNGELAYLGSGSAEWANWARAILSLQSTGVPGLYELHAAKRGSKLNWKDPETDTPIYSKTIAWSRKENVICWREADAEDLALLSSDSDVVTPKIKDSDFLDLIGGSTLSTAQLREKAKEELNMSRATFYRTLARLEEMDKIFKSPISSEWSVVRSSKPRRDD